MSSQNISLLCLSLVATTAVTTLRFVTPAGALAGADANTLGVTRSTGAIADKVPVDILGTAIVEAGAAVAAGATVKSDATGRAITWVTSGAKVGLALDAATAAGQFIEVLLIPNVA
jgi:hypothetical protein